jgi:hypothetical protein
MSFPRLFGLRLLLVLGLPLITGACGAPIILTAVSYGADGASLVSTGKTATDHLISMSAKQDCAMWRMVQNKAICKDHPPGEEDPYDVNYKTPERVQSEAGVQYLPPARQPAGTPATAWESGAYTSATAAEPAATVAETAAPEPLAAPEPAANPPVATKIKGTPTRPTPRAAHLAKKAKAKAKPPSRGPAATGS